MAIGDVVNGVFNAATTMSFQPAAGVEVCLTNITSYGVNGSLTDGAVSGLIFTGSPTFVTYSLTKIFVNNAIYLTAAGASSFGSCFTGIQIK
ncbi:hypothetical protein OAC76_06850 [Amylibacter sp.]|nr:hypothetical protein [Amylibacter sp.]